MYCGHLWKKRDNATLLTVFFGLCAIAQKHYFFFFVLIYFLQFLMRFGFFHMNFYTNYISINFFPHNFASHWKLFELAWYMHFFCSIALCLKTFGCNAAFSSHFFLSLKRADFFFKYTFLMPHIRLCSVNTKKKIVRCPFSVFHQKLFKQQQQNRIVF